MSHAKITKIRQNYISTLTTLNVKYNELYGTYQNGKEIYFNATTSFEDFGNNLGICIKGNPKTGKTILFDYLLQQWSLSRLLCGYEWTWKVNLQDLNDQHHSSVEDIILHQCFGGDMGTFEIAWAQKRLLLLDNFDTMSQEFYNGIMTFLRTTSCDVIISSRTSILEKEYKLIELEGLSEKGMIDYLKMVYGDVCDFESRSERLINLISKSKLLLDLCRIPIILDNAYHSELPNFKVLVGSKESQYLDSSYVEAIMNQMLIHYLIGADKITAWDLHNMTGSEIHKLCNVELLFLEYAAMSKFVNGSCGSDVMNYISELGEKRQIGQLVTMDFLTHIGDGNYEFVHSVLQDYFVSRFLVNYLTKEYADKHDVYHDFDKAFTLLGESPSNLINAARVKSNISKFMRELLDRSPPCTKRKFNYLFNEETGYFRLLIVLLYMFLAIMVVELV